LGKSAADLGKTVTVLGKTADFLGKSRGDLGKSSDALGETRHDMGKSNENLGKTSAVLAKSATVLGKSMVTWASRTVDLGKSGVELGKFTGDLGKTANILPRKMPAKTSLRPHLDSPSFDLDNLKGGLKSLSTGLDSPRMPFGTPEKRFDRPVSPCYYAVDGRNLAAVSGEPLMNTSRSPHENRCPTRESPVPGDWFDGKECRRDVPPNPRRRF